MHPVLFLSPPESLKSILQVKAAREIPVGLVIVGIWGMALVVVAVVV
jgi:hypothetical protein